MFAAGRDCCEDLSQWLSPTTRAAVVPDTSFATAGPAHRVVIRGGRSGPEYSRATRTEPGASTSTGLGNKKVPRCDNLPGREIPLLAAPITRYATRDVRRRTPVSSRRCLQRSFAAASRRSQRAEYLGSTSHAATCWSCTGLPEGHRSRGGGETPWAPLDVFAYERYVRP